MQAATNFGTGLMKVYFLRYPKFKSIFLAIGFLFNPSILNQRHGYLISKKDDDEKGLSRLFAASPMSEACLLCASDCFVTPIIDDLSHLV